MRVDVECLGTSVRERGFGGRSHAGGEGLTEGVKLVKLRITLDTIKMSSKQ